MPSFSSYAVAGTVRTRRVAAVCLAVLAASIPDSGVLAAQNITTGELKGVIRDATGRVVQGATIVAYDSAMNRSRNAESKDDGSFSILALPPATYRVTVDAANFQQVVQEDVRITLASVVELDLTLTVAGVKQSVVVQERQPLLDLNRTAVSTVIVDEQIQNLPTNGRNFIDFSQLTAGVASDRTPQQGSSATSGLTFAGQRARSNSILVDGFDDNDTMVGGVRATFSQEVVREFQVIANSFSAEFGKASGGVVNIVTRSGTNRHSGGGFVFFRDEWLNAKEHFEQYDPAGQSIDREKAPYRQTQFGATLGGPLKRDRTFYFLAFERLDITANNFVNINDTDLISIPGQPSATAAAILRQAGFPVETGNVPYSVDAQQLFGRIDHVLGPGHSLDARVNWAIGENENSEPWGGLVAKSRGGVLQSNDLLVAVSDSWIPSSSMINELRGQIAYRDQNVLALDPSCDGPCDGSLEGGPTLEVIGVASVGRHRFSPQARETVRYQVLDTLTLTRGRNLLRLGVDYNYIDHPSGTLPLHFGGRYIFQSLPVVPGLIPQSLSSIQALALGLPAAYIQGYGNDTSKYSVQDLSLFAQDDINIGRDLTLNLGVRYQHQFWPDIGYTLKGVGDYTFPSEHNVAPRLAAAWTPWGRRQLSVHGSYGIFYDNHLTSLSGVTDIVDGSSDGVRTLVRQLPQSFVPWNSPGHKLPEASAGTFPSLVIAVDPTLETPYAHHASGGVRYEFPRGFRLETDVIYVRGFNQVGTLDYNPIIPELGTGRRPEDLVVGGVPAAGTSASVLQYTTFGETWYKGLTVSVAKNVARSRFQAVYTLSKAEDTSTDYQNAFIPQDTGKGRNPDDPTGLPIGFDPRSEKGPSLQDQRHRFVFNAIQTLPKDFQVSGIVAIGSGRPYNILAGTDLNGDGNGGAFPPDRARENPADPTSSVGRNTGILPSTASVDIRVSRVFRMGRNNLTVTGEVFNLFNRTNYTEINNIFGRNPFPESPDSTYGQFEKAGPPLQAQLGLRLQF